MIYKVWEDDPESGKDFEADSPTEAGEMFAEWDESNGNWEGGSYDLKVLDTETQEVHNVEVAVDWSPNFTGWVK